MKKFFSIMCAVALIFTVGQLNAQEYLIDGANPLALTIGCR